MEEEKKESAEETEAEAVIEAEVQAEAAAKEKADKNKTKKKKKKPIDFLKYYVKPHKKIARDVTPEDIKKIVEDANIMFNLCYTQNGPYPGGHAVAHPQINDTDPLRFFVTNQREICINPIILRHTQVKIDNEEGCLSYPDKMPIRVPRWNKCEVEFTTLDIDSPTGLSERKKVSLNGIGSRVMQHEIDHLDGISIFDRAEENK